MGCGASSPSADAKTPMDAAARPLASLSARELQDRLGRADMSAQAERLAANGVSGADLIAAQLVRRDEDEGGGCPFLFFRKSATKNSRVSRTVLYVLDWTKTRCHKMSSYGMEYPGLLKGARAYIS